MRPRPDAALEVALEQRQRMMDEAQAVLSHHERALQEQLRVLGEAQSRVKMVLLQIDAAQRPVHGAALPVALLGDLERLLDWCEVQVLVQRDQLDTIRAEAEEARGALAVAHQGVRALQLVLEARKAERSEKERRVELRMADETAARVHSRNTVSVR
jgi:flagellar biosynthesis chaperone FliJ